MAAPTLQAWLLGSRLCTSEQLGTWGPTNTIDHVHWKGLGLEVQLGLDVALAMANARNWEKPLVNVAAETVPEVHWPLAIQGVVVGPPHLRAVMKTVFQGVRFWQRIPTSSKIRENPMEQSSSSSSDIISTSAWLPTCCAHTSFLICSVKSGFVVAAADAWDSCQDVSICAA